MIFGCSANNWNESLLINSFSRFGELLNVFLAYLFKQKIAWVFLSRQTKVSLYIPLPICFRELNLFNDFLLMKNFGFELSCFEKFSYNGGIFISLVGSAYLAIGLLDGGETARFFQKLPPTFFSLSTFLFC